MSINAALSEELEVIHAIFGEDTSQTIRTTKDRTRVQLRVPSPSYMSCTPNPTESIVTFLADFSSSYPQVMPEVIGFDVSLFEYYEGGASKIHLALQILLKDVFRAGEPCMYDWLLKSSPAIHCLSRDGFDWVELTKIAMEVDIEQKACIWTKSQKPLDVERL